MGRLILDTAVCAAKVSEVCVETTVVVDTLGPARRRTHGLCVTVRCQWKKKKKDRLDADLWTGTFAHAGLERNASNIHLLNLSLIHI